MSLRRKPRTIDGWLSVLAPPASSPEQGPGSSEIDGSNDDVDLGQPHFRLTVNGTALDWREAWTATAAGESDLNVGAMDQPTGDRDGFGFLLLTVPESDALAQLTSRALLAQLLSNHAKVKLAGPIFEGRPPDEETATALVDAFQTGEAPAWLAAYLLGCLRGQAAYDVVLAILEGDARLLSEPYAAVALAKIAGPDAVTDLLRVMREGQQQRNREGALYGLGMLRDCGTSAAILAAARDGLVRRHVAGTIVARMDVPPEVLAAWVRSSDDLQRDIAIEAAVALFSPNSGGGAVALARAVKEALSSGTVKLAPRIGRALSGRIDEILGEG